MHEQLNNHILGSTKITIPNSNYHRVYQNNQNSMNQFHVSKYPNYNMASHNSPAYLNNNCHQQNMHNWLPSNSISNEQPTSTNQCQRLKVEDALSYLDKVKLQFGSQPHVYNDFLDIMKEFKSQTIDTPGVISRVSMLFRGHTDLIVGFNTFLPPGYKIEVQTNETINVHQPGQQVMSLTCLNTTYNLHNSTNIYVPQTASAPRHIENSSSSSVSNVGSSQSQPVEFNHAISYVNKIKQYYQDRPDIYKAFLDILHNYQKEQMNVKEGIRGISKMTITETEVYNQVSKLFQDQPELLNEFKQFLPDADGSYDQSLKMEKSIKSNVSSKHSNSSSPRRIPPQHNQSSRVNKRQNLTVLKENDSSEVRDSKQEDVDSTPHKLNLEKDNLAFQHYLEAHRNEQLTFKEFNRRVSSIIKKNPKLRHQVNQLKLQHQQMQQLTASNETKSLAAVAVAHTTQPAILEPKDWILDISSCEKYGRHYHILPSSHVLKKCSGRTELCNSVLNDTHVLNASTLSEEELKEYDDLSYKRSIYEDHIFQCEDERYELDMLIDSNECMMRGLYRCQQRMQTMNNDDLNRYQIDDLSSAFSVSPVQIEIALRRLYGTRWGTILEGLQKCPNITIPLIHRCMKSKDVEWREVRKQMEKSWADTMDRLYLKSLDLQASKFKQADVKLLRTKSLIKDVQLEKDKDEAVLHSVNLLDEMNQYEDLVLLVSSCVNKLITTTVEEQHQLAHVLQVVVPEILVIPEVYGVVKVKEEIKDDGEDNLEDSKCMKPMVFTSILDYAEKTILNEDSKRSQFYCNEHWYVLLRLLILLGQRLTYFRKKSQDLINEDVEFKANRYSKIAQAIKLRNPDIYDPNNSYGIFLELVRSFATNNLDNISFEDKLREVFGVQAFVGFTIDKLLHSIVKMIQHILSKEESQSLQRLFEENKTKVMTSDDATANDEIISSDSYHLNARRLISDKALFKVICKKTHSSHVISFEMEEADSKASSPAPTPPDAPIKEEVKLESKEVDIGSEDGGCGRRKRKIIMERRQNFKRLKTSDSVVLVAGIIPDFCRKFKKRLPPHQAPNWPTDTNSSILQTLEDLALLNKRVALHTNGSDADDQTSLVEHERVFNYYRHGALSKAKKIHRKVCLHRLRRYKVVLERWRRKNNINSVNSLSDWQASSLIGQSNATIRTIENDNGLKLPYYLLL